MDLKIKDVADLLNVSETTIRRWLLDGKIPAYKLNRQYRFSKIEIENWMMKRKLKLTEDEHDFLPTQTGESEVFSKKEGQPQMGNQQFGLYRAINRGGVFAKVKGETKEELIENVTPLIAKQLRLDPDVLTELLLDREELMPTAFNNGVAVPHARECIQHAPFDLIAVVYPEKPIEWGALDEKPVDVLFFLFATGDKIHLHLLAKIAHLSSDETLLNFIRTQPDKAALLEVIREWETSLKVS